MISLEGLKEVLDKAEKDRAAGVTHTTSISPAVVKEIVAELMARRPQSTCPCGGMLTYSPHSPICEHYRLIEAGHRSDFDYVGDFFKKFGLPSVTYEGAQPHHISPDLEEFAIKCISEELEELKKGYREHDLLQIADALIDLAYFTLGRAHMHGLPWAELFAEVQRANMAKEHSGIDHLFVECPEGTPTYCDFKPTCNGTERDPGNICHHGYVMFQGKADYSNACGLPKWKHSRRGHAIDIIKPPGWKEPDIAGVLRAAGYEVEGGEDRD